jgi:hypothetical protein
VSVRVLSEHDVRRLLPVAECIEPMAGVLAALARDELHNPLRVVVLPPGAEVFMGLKSLGLAVEDLAAAEHVLRLAEAEGAGVEIDL